MTTTTTKPQATRKGKGKGKGKGGSTVMHVQPGGDILSMSKLDRRMAGIKARALKILNRLEPVMVSPAPTAHSALRDATLAYELAFINADPWDSWWQRHNAAKSKALEALEGFDGKLKSFAERKLDAAFNATRQQQAA